MTVHTHACMCLSITIMSFFCVRLVKCEEDMRQALTSSNGD